MKQLVTVCVITASMILSACSNVTNQDVGTVAGGVAGGLLGSQFGKGTGQLVAIGVGTLAGAYLGGAVGKSMDASDKQKMTSTLENNPQGKPAYWQNSNTGTQYTVTPTKNITVNGNPYCREYQSTAMINGKKQEVYGTACRQPDGSWKIIS